MNIETQKRRRNKNYHSIPYKMTIASDVLQRHFQTLVEDNAQWQTLIADDLIWELPYAPAIGHPARLSGRAEVVRHVKWFLEAVENFRFYDLNVSCSTSASLLSASGTRAKPLLQLGGSPQLPFIAFRSNMALTVPPRVPPFVCSLYSCSIFPKLNET
jgi:hypothetical protein